MMMIKLTQERLDEVLALKLEEFAELRQNAERYLKLRAMVRGERHLGTGHNQGFAFPSRFELHPLGDIMRGSVAQHLDAAIDAMPAAGDDAESPDTKMKQVTLAITEYHQALSDRAHGGVAASVALSKIQQALNLHWVG